MGPRTWRCRHCGALYIDQAPEGQRLYHRCAPQRRDPATGQLVPPGPWRDENITQDREGGPARMKSVGKGRELVAVGDALTGATEAAFQALLVAAPIGASPAPEEPLEGPDVYVMPARE